MVFANEGCSCGGTNEERDNLMHFPFCPPLHLEGSRGCLDGSTLLLIARRGTGPWSGGLGLARELDSTSYIYGPGVGFAG